MIIFIVKQNLNTEKIAQNFQKTNPLISAQLKDLIRRLPTTFNKRMATPRYQLLARVLELCLKTLSERKVVDLGT